MKLLWVKLLKNPNSAMKYCFLIFVNASMFSITIEIRCDDVVFQYFLVLHLFICKSWIFKHKIFCDRSCIIAYFKIPLKIRFGIPFYAHNMYQKVLFYCHFTIYVMWYIWALYILSASMFTKICGRKWWENGLHFWHVLST